MIIYNHIIRHVFSIIILLGLFFSPYVPILTSITQSGSAIAVPLPTVVKPKDHITDLLNAIDWPFITKEYVASLTKGLFKPCFCGTFIFGFSQDFWAPSYIQENVAKPGLLALIGVDIKLLISPMIDSTSSNDKGEAGGDQDNEHSRHAHFWDFPLFKVIGFGICGSSDGISLAYMSELDPTWISPAIATMLNPASLLVSGLPASVAGIADCAAVSVIGNNAMSDMMFFSLGCWGLTYPASGRSATSNSMLESDLLFFGRTLAKAHMIAAVFATTVKHAGTLCAPMLYPVIAKDEYLFSFIYPTMKVRNPYTKFALGVSTLIMPEIGLTIPFKEGASLFLLYKHKQCCLF